MTREEARTILQQYKADLGHDAGWDFSTIEALDMAINTLSEPITTGQHCCECGKHDLSMWETTSTEDCISRQAVKELYYKNGYIDFLKICELPPVTPQPKTGHWIFDEILDKHYYCSECKSMGVDYWDYCPYCGAKMVEPQEGSGEE